MLFILKRKIVINVLLLLFCFAYSATAQNTLRLSPQNHHYVMYQQKPVLLITSAEHYGALLNLDFDYIAYLNALQKEGMNNTRVFSGAYVERENDIKWMLYNNTLAPKASQLIAPWKRSNTPGYINGGNKFDLDQWDDQYFIRLKDLLQQAANRGIMVEFTLFGNQYSDSIYQYSPLYPDNNIQGKGPKGEKRFLLFQSLADHNLVVRQEAMVRKIVQELNGFDNLYYEISNEPYNEVKDSAVVNEWNEHFARLVKQTEESLPKKHLVATNQSVVDSKYTDIANYHYVHISNIPDFDSLLRLNKVLSFDETMGSLIHSDVNDVRVEAWDFILHGGGAYNNLSWEYTPSATQGTPGADTIRQYLQHLQQFMNTFQFVNMKYNPDVVTLFPPKAITRVLAEKGKQYAVYIHHSKPYDIVPKTSDFVSKYEADSASFKDTIALELPAGTYSVQWYNPVKGGWYEKPQTLKHSGGNHTIYTPLFTTDIALKIMEK